MKYDDLTPEQRERAEAAATVAGEAIGEALVKIAAAAKVVVGVFVEVSAAVQERGKAEGAEAALRPDPDPVDTTPPTPGSTIYVVGYFDDRTPYVERLRRAFPGHPVIQRGWRSVESDRYGVGDMIFIVDVLARDAERLSKVESAINRNRLASGGLRIDPFHVLDLVGLEATISELTS